MAREYRPAGTKLPWAGRGRRPIPHAMDPIASVDPVSSLIGQPGGAASTNPFAGLSAGETSYLALSAAANDTASKAITAMISASPAAPASDGMSGLYSAAALSATLSSLTLQNPEQALSLLGIHVDHAASTAPAVPGDEATPFDPASWATGPQTA